MSKQPPVELEFCFAGRTYRLRATTPLARRRVVHMVTAAAKRHVRDLAVELTSAGARATGIELVASFIALPAVA